MADVGLELIFLTSSHTPHAPPERALGALGAHKEAQPLGDGWAEGSHRRLHDESSLEASCPPGIDAILSPLVSQPLLSLLCVLPYLLSVPWHLTLSLLQSW